MKRIYNILMLTALMFAFVGCEQGGTDGGDENLAPYGYYTIGEQEVAVKSCVTTEGSQLLLKISPLDNIMEATTYAVVGVHTSLLGERLDVERRFHNDDYLFVYEDPVSYYSHLRPLQSGTILMKRSTSGNISVEVDVKLYDGTPFRYAVEGLKVVEK